VFARVRDPRSGLFEVTGDTVNTAARLRSAAGPDEILVGPGAQRRVAPFFELEPLEERSLRGKAQPVALCRVLGPAAASFFDVARARGLVPYVGRQRELAVLRHAWEEARAGRGGVITVAGAPGVGKTRLVHEFRRDLGAGTSPALVLHGRCAPYGNVPPYQPFIDALARFVARDGDAKGEGRGDGITTRLRAIGDLADATVGVLAYLLAPDTSRHLLPAGVDGAQLRDAILGALADLVVTGSARQPILLAFDDWHSADEASRAALRRITQPLGNARVLILVNHRSGEVFEPVRAGVVAQLELMPLDADATEVMAQSALDVAALPRGLAEFIHERTFGNPFFVEEICRSLTDAGVFVQHSGALA